ncbi:hypothetical protein [Chitinimonas naiadis]
MAEHWPSALLMWALGAACALALLKDWPHTLLVAILVPTWLWGEWAESLVRTYSFDHSAAPVIGTVLLALAYLSAQIKDGDPAWRRTLSWLGAIAVIPSCILLGFANITWRHVDQTATPYNGQYLTWIIALALPCLVAFFLRRRSAVLLILPLLWSLVLVQFQWDHREDEFILYGLYALGSVGIATWGVRVQRTLIVNLGIIAFACTTTGFYFSSILDKLNRSASLVVGGLLFLIGGWLLEKLRRRLIARMGAQP